MDDFLFGAILGDHWPMFAAAAVLWAGGRLSKSLTGRHRTGRFWRAWHATFTVHPIVAGAFFGALTGSPVPVAVRELGTLSGPLYFACAGFLASFGVKFYRAIKGRQSQE